MEDHSHQQKLHQPESHQPESKQPEPRQLLSQQSLPPQSTEQPVAPQPLPPQPAGQPDSPKKSNDPLHGLTLEKIVTHLVESYGWEQLAENIRINCFSSNPSIQSSLKFLRKTPWARTKVEDFYKYSLRRKKLK